MEMIAEETKERFQGKMGVEYRVDKQAVEKPVTKSSEEIEQMLDREEYYMELLLLVYEVKEWEQLFWNKFKAFRDQTGSDRVEEKERWTREWRANCWKRLNSQMHAAQKMLQKKGKDWTPLANFDKLWASSISQFFEMFENLNSMSLSIFKERMDSEYRWQKSGENDDEIRLRMKNEIEDTEFRLKRGSDLGRFDQFWDDDNLFECRYSRSKF
jgi:hypothetical protein